MMFRSLLQLALACSNEHPFKQLGLGIARSSVQEVHESSCLVTNHQPLRSLQSDSLSAVSGLQLGET